MKHSVTAVFNRQQRLIVAAFSLAMIYSGIAQGAGAGMPWETPLNSILTSLTGPVAKVAGVAAIVLAGLGIAYSEGGSGMRKLVYIVFGLSIAFTGATFFLPFFGYAGGAAF
jgi:type IV secretory pathway VirB2 component (pilin)